jgi:hypothetical protein
MRWLDAASRAEEATADLWQVRDHALLALTARPALLTAPERRLMEERLAADGMTRPARRR